MTNNFQFFPAFVVSAILCLAFSEILFSDLSINGEFVYSCGFAIVLYGIWCETYQTFNSLKPYFGYTELSVFWFKYKELESCVLSLIGLKLNLISTILNVFTLTTIILKTLNLIKYNFFIYKTTIQTLNKVKLKIKALPLQ